MADILIQPCNDVHCYVFCNEAIQHELSDYLSFEAPGAEFQRKRMKRYRNWDGRIRLFNRSTQQVYVGLIPRVKRFAKRRGYSVTCKVDYKNRDWTPAETDALVSRYPLPAGFDLRDYQHTAITVGLRERRCVLISATGCHPVGTRVVMADGTLKSVDTIVVGDRLLGPNGDVRTVLRLLGEEDDLYEVRPHRGSDSFRVNGEHVLSLQCSTNRRGHKPVVNLTVNEYLEKNKDFKHLYKLYRSAGVDFPDASPKPLPLDPYLLGLLLGDGHLRGRSVSLTTADPEIDQAFRQQAERYGMDVRVSIKPDNRAYSLYLKEKRVATGSCPCGQLLGGKSFQGRRYWCSRSCWVMYGNPIARALQTMGLGYARSGTKFIPEQYLVSSREVRLRVLAGLVDTDGTLANGTYYEIVTKSKQLAFDVARLGRSLGFTVSCRTKCVNRTPYYRVNVQGDISQVPVRVVRKQATTLRNPNKSHLRTGFSIVPCGRERVYGFELDGDRLYLLEDFTVTHNSGKSLVLYYLVRAYLEQDRRVLLIVPTITLVDQMVEDWRSYGWADVDDVVHRIVGGKTKDSSLPVVVSTWQSVYRLDHEWFQSFHAVLGDEVHTFRADSLKLLMEHCVQIPCRVGVTGTLDGAKCNKLVVEGLFGPAHRVARTADLQKQGHLTPIIVQGHVLDYPDSDRQLVEAQKRIFTDEIDFIVTHPERMNWLVEFVGQLPGNVLVLFQYVEKHGQPLYDALNTRYGADRPVHFIHGQTPAEDRERLRVFTENQKSSILVASYGVFSTGVNIKRLHCVVFASPSKSRYRVLQSIGRGLRLHSSKRVVHVMDIIDDLHTTKHHNYVYKHWFVRASFYEEEAFPLELYTHEVPVSKGTI